MKTFILILGAIVLITFASATAGEVVIKEAPLRYHDVATTDGAELFDNICAVCHGSNGKGDGPAAPALIKPVPDLTVLSTNNDGEYPLKYVEKAISGNSRIIAHGTIDMPVWEDELLALRPDWKSSQRRSFTEKRIRNLAEHIEGMQIE